MIKDKIIKILDRLPVEELENVLSAVELIEKKYQSYWNLFGKGVIVSTLFDEAENIIAQWDNKFAGHLNEKVKNDIHYNQFKWHIFSYEVRDCLKEDKARKAFNGINKSECYVMYQNCPYVTLLSNANNIEAEDFDDEQDVYVFDTAFTWTYIKTHESEFGPYFCSTN